ncbi:GNAT family N-acetyltransferase [Tenacibaculum halocynthiae]|uniref:GNAT family N-acetyltransferase n=1 Tax=Tenacibaculum halocynthiae TaxID=1254437 RepID=UPI00389433FE
MTEDILKKLENPVWYSLCEAHSKFTVNYNGVKFYDPDVCPFGAFTNLNETKNAIEKYANLTSSLFVVGQEPNNSSNTKLNRIVPCDQMILKTLKEPKYDSEIIKLTEKHINELYDLVWLVMPGYYKKRTFEMGDYYGIIKDNKLIAATGERLQLNDFIEISAVVTHPDYTRKGFAKQLVAHTTKKIIEKNKTPILHVADINTGAIKLYESLGYKTIRKIIWRHYINV